MILTDTHCHLDHQKFDADREAVITRANDSGLIRLLVPGLHLQSSEEAVKLAETHPSVFAAVGFHPTDLDQFNESAYDSAKTLAAHPKVVAIGEIGIDYYWVKADDQRAAQRDVLKKQLAFARSISKPVIIHMREAGDAWSGAASEDLLAILSEWHASLRGSLAELPGVLHSFNGNLETAEKALALNFYLGITGPVTYKKAEEKRRIVAQLPLDRLLLETDSPFLTPEPFREKRNEPSLIPHIADKIAQIHSKDPDEIAAVTTANADRLFGWGA